MKNKNIILRPLFAGKNIGSYFVNNCWMAALRLYTMYMEDKITLNKTR